MTIGQEPTLLLSSVAQSAFDYVALGHIHKHQILSDSPPVVYAGSLERVDFGEENDDKGFYVVEIEPEPASGKRKVSYDFHPVKSRRFLTINVSLEEHDVDPAATMLEAISKQAEKVRDAIVRLNISLPAQTAGQLRDSDISEALKDAHHFTIARDIKRETRLRLENTSVEETVPLEALKAYLESKKVSPDRAKVLIEYGKRLIERQSEKG